MYIYSCAFVCYIKPERFVRALKNIVCGSLNTLVSNLLCAFIHVE